MKVCQQSTFVNNYYLGQVDSCGYQSDTSIIHSSILLETNSYDFEEIEISWTRYKGWDYIIDGQMIVPVTVNTIYELYRSENNIDFERIITVIDELYQILMEVLIILIKIYVTLIILIMY